MWSWKPRNKRRIIFSSRSRFGFYDALNISGHYRRFRQWTWKIRQFCSEALIYDTGPTALLPSWRKSYSWFLRSEKNPSTPAGIEPGNLGSSGEYDNHWTTGSTLLLSTQALGLHTTLHTFSWPPFVVTFQTINHYHSIFLPQINFFLRRKVRCHDLGVISIIRERHSYCNPEIE